MEESEQTRRRGPRPQRSPDIPPPPPFFFTCDQLAAMLHVSEQQVRTGYLFYEGRTPGPHYPDFLLARNIAPRGHDPEWRVTAQELSRWLKFHGYRLHMRGWV